MEVWNDTKRVGAAVVGPELHVGVQDRVSTSSVVTKDLGRNGINGLVDERVGGRVGGGGDGVGVDSGAKRRRNDGSNAGGVAMSTSSTSDANSTRCVVYSVW